MSVNKVILIGRLGKDPETRYYMTSGEAVTNATLATSETWKDKSGEKQEKTEWHKLVFYRRLAEIAGEYLKKGSMIYVEGKLHTSKYTDKEGVEKYSTEIVVNEMTMLGGKTADNDEQTVQDAPQSNAVPVRRSVPQPKSRNPEKAIPAKPFDSFDDDIPFKSCSIR